MKVRDKKHRKSDYLGQECEASFKDCPDKPCYTPHDCGRRNSAGKWVREMRCVYRDNHGCPDEEIKESRGER